MYFCHYASAPLSITERLIHFNEWFHLSSHVSWMVWRTGGNLQKACAETGSSMLEVHGDMLWETMVMNGKGIGYWKKTGWKATSCAGLASLLRSSENGIVCLQFSKWRRGMWFFIMPPGKRKAGSGKSRHFQQQQRASPSPPLHHLSASEVVPQPTDDLPSWSTHVEKKSTTPSSGVEHIMTSPSHALAVCILPKRLKGGVNCVQSSLMISLLI